METSRLSPMGYLTLALLAAFVVESALVFWLAVAQVPGGPDPGTAFVMVPFVTFGLLLAVLAWGGQRVGFLGGAAYGVVNLVASVGAMVGLFGPLSPESLAGTVPSAILSLALIWSGWMGAKG